MLPVLFGGAVEVGMEVEGTLWFPSICGRLEVHLILLESGPSGTQYMFQLQSPPERSQTCPCKLRA